MLNCSFKIPVLHVDDSSGFVVNLGFSDWHTALRSRPLILTSASSRFCVVMLKCVTWVS